MTTPKPQPKTATKQSHNEKYVREMIAYSDRNRPLAQPKRAKKRTHGSASLRWADKFADKLELDLTQKYYLQVAYLAGYRAARRRAGGAK